MQIQALDQCGWQLIDVFHSVCDTTFAPRFFFDGTCQVMLNLWSITHTSNAVIMSTEAQRVAYVWVFAKMVCDDSRQDLHKE